MRADPFAIKLLKQSFFSVQNPDMWPVKLISRTEQKIHAQGFDIYGEVGNEVYSIDQKICSNFISPTPYRGYVIDRT